MPSNKRTGLTSQAGAALVRISSSRAGGAPFSFSFLAGVAVGQGDVCYSTKVRQLNRVGGSLVLGSNSEEEGGKEHHVGFDMINYDIFI
mmetsp:Transcript_13471/g.27342  ORF Transcript_13471/g.27342 Transcript_13471/m.27342 type:complete len:89 (+) Transcript_13471:475-741(+)